MYQRRILNEEEADMRIMGIDYGERRIGVAICDELGIAAHALRVIEHKGMPQVAAEISKLLEDHQVEVLVVGFPLLLSGEEGRQCQKVNDFIAELSKTVSVPIVKEDETCTTSFAQEILSTLETKRNKRRKVVDKIAAAAILQSYLDRIHREKQKSELECT